MIRILMCLFVASVVFAEEDIPPKAKKYYEEREKEQLDLESKTLFSNTQLDFLRKNDGVALSLQAKETPFLKGKPVADFIRKHGYPNKTFVPHNQKDIKGGMVVWEYNMKDKNIIHMHLMVVDGSIVIRNVFFFKRETPTK